MRILILIVGSMLLIGCSDDSGNSGKVTSDKMALKCFYVRNTDSALIILDNKNEGDKADVVPFSSTPQKSFTSVPVEWTPSNIVVNLVFEEDYTTTLDTRYYEYIISRSTLEMEWSTYIISKHKIRSTTERLGNPSVKYPGYCELTEIESPKNVF